VPYPPQDQKDHSRQESSVSRFPAAASLQELLTPPGHLQVDDGM